MDCLNMNNITCFAWFRQANLWRMVVKAADTMHIHDQQNIWPAKYMTSKKATPCVQCTYMTSKIHVQRTNESARCYNNTVSKLKLVPVNQDVVGILCAKMHRRSHTWHTWPATFKPNRTSICWSCILVVCWCIVHGVVGHVFCWSCMCIVSAAETTS